MLSKREAGQGEYCERRIDNIGYCFHVLIPFIVCPSLAPHSEKSISGRSQVYCPDAGERLLGKFGKLAKPRISRIARIGQTGGRYGETTKTEGTDEVLNRR